MPLALLRRIPLGCYVGALLIVLGSGGLDIRGVYLGVLIMVLSPVAIWYQRRTQREAGE
ncbi:MAG: hypothetical protein ACRDPJ_06830 [Nocardioidaceae bacterium]